MVPRNWILEVLTDLSKFSDKNNLPGLSRHLQQAIDIAEEELDGVDLSLMKSPSLPSDRPEKFQTLG